jgi:hypothetical protein
MNILSSLYIFVTEKELKTTPRRVSMDVLTEGDSTFH